MSHTSHEPNPYSQPEHQSPFHPDQPGQGPTGNTVEDRGFFPALFDFSFTSFVTIKFARIIYILLIVLIAVSWLFSVIIGFTDSALVGILLLVFGWIPGLITLVLARVTMEFYIAMVRTSQNTAAARAELQVLRTRQG